MNLETLSLQDSVISAMDTCIQQNILKEFLIEQKAEVIAMSIYEYNEEYVKKTLYEDGYDSGKDDGISLGMELGNMKMLVNNVETVMINFHLDLASACQGLDISVAEYEDAKTKLFYPFTPPATSPFCMYFCNAMKTIIIGNDDITAAAENKVQCAAN